MKEHGFAVKCTQVTKSYKTGESSVMALRGVDLEVKKGELLILAGPSGCGKTTLISVISGILNQDEGQCLVFDQDLLHMREREKIQFRAQNVGFVFQQFNLIPTLTAAENAAVPLIINGIHRKVATQKAAELLAQVGLKDRVNSFPAQLSGGEQQRVAISRAIIHDPHLVVCDEPTSSLDRDNGHMVMGLMKKLVTNNGRALIVVTHDNRIFEFADRIAEMEDGRIKKISSSQGRSQ